ncbi:MAG: DHA2 family efflux MFS transporter permease subunit [Betaproteobacteria bacterium]|nr:DHA2 family efflux MFS transporter permease subunit [Betaproteobacteria bacterium]
MSETIDVLFARYGASYRWLVAVTVLLGMTSAVVTTTTVNVAIPDIMGTFGMGQDRAQWVSTGALAGTTVAMLLNAWMITRFGPRRTFLGALSVFVAALMVAGSSPNDSVLIFARVAQGAVAGLLQPLAIYTLYRVFPADQKGKAMGLFGITVILGPALGPTLGGILIEHFNWRYVFFIAMPVAAAAMLLGSMFMPEREESAPRTNFDWTAFALLSLALACLLTGLSGGQRAGWNSDYILSLLAVAVAAGVAFVARELRSQQPLVALRALANPQFAAASAVACIFGAGLFGSVYLVPLFVQTVQGFTPLAAGLLLMPAGLVLGLFLPISGYLTDRLSPRWLIIGGLLCFCVSSYWMGGVDVNTPFWSLAWWIVVGRVGLGLINPSLNVAALRALRPELLGQGAGMINFFRQLGGAFGVNLLSVALDRRTSFHSDALTSLQVAGNSATAELVRAIERALSQAGASPDLQLQGAMHFLGRVVQSQAYTLAFRDCFLIVALVFALALLPAWIIGRTQSGVSRLAAGAPA